MNINTKINTDSPSAFTIRNHAFKAKSSSITTINDSAFQTKSPSAFTIRNHAFKANTSSLINSMVAETQRK